MKQPLISILIPTVVGRESVLQKIGRSIITQVKNMGAWKQFEDIRLQILQSPNVELITFKDNKELTIGEKRELLYKKANGLFSWQIDDDDNIADNAIELILEAIKSNPEVDCITFEEYVNINGVEYRSNHSLEYGDWDGDGNKLFMDNFHFHRTPFMKDVIRTDIAKSVSIPHIRFGEDHQWSQALKPHLKTEIHIPEQIYRYIHISSPHHERYGFDKEN